MRTRIGVRVAAAMLIPAAIAWSQVVGTLQVQPESRLTVSGTSTVRDFQCKATSFAATVEAALPDAPAAVVAGRAGIGAVTLTVPVAELDCKNGTMNEHMRKAIKAKEHPEIVFRLDSYDLAPSDSGTRATLRGTLRLGGVERPVTMEATATTAPGGALVVAGKHELRMTEYGLKPPSLMLGTMKVNEKVSVGFDIHLKP
jgi:polyisoprenoid-binding protein YceI